MNNIATNETTTLSENKKKSPKTKIAIVTIALALAATIATLLFVFLTPPQKTDEEKYNEAKTALAERNYTKAYNLFRETKGYADSSDFLEDFEVICEKKITTFDNSKTTETFNKDGKLLEEIIETGKKITKYVYTYDENGNPLTYTLTKDDIKIAGFECSYDKDGNLLKKSEQQRNALLYWENTYENGRPVKKFFKYTPSEDDPTHIISSELFYDSNNQLIKIIETVDDGTTTQTITTEYSNGLIIKEFLKSEEPSYSSEITYTYDNSGNLLTKHCKGSEGNDYYERKCTYNENGKLLTVINHDSANVERYNLQNIYNADGVLKESIEITRRPQDENEYHTTTSHSYYDDKGNIIKETFDEPYNFNVRDYTYDNMNNLIKEVSSDYDKESDGSVSDEADIITYTRTYDSYGNLLSVTSEYSDEKTTSRYEYTGITVIYNPKI